MIKGRPLLHPFLKLMESYANFLIELRGLYKMSDKTFFTIHELKTDPKPYDDIEGGLKNNTVRLDDREYRVDDYLVLRRTVYTGDEMRTTSDAKTYNNPDELEKDVPRVPKPLEYSGVALMCKVTHIHKDKGLQPGWAVLSFTIIDGFPNGEGGQVFQIP